VYFEEWPEPLVARIGWVGELIERAGGVDLFPAGIARRAAAERTVTAGAVVRARPEVILACWCGKPFRRAQLTGRPGWADLPAARAGRVHGLPPEDFLQPGFRLVFGYGRLKRLLAAAGGGGRPG
jgi:iron complex transport system substrate-binding protein